MEKQKTSSPVQGTPKASNPLGRFYHPGDSSSRDLLKIPDPWRSPFQPFQRVTFSPSQEGHKELPGWCFERKKTQRNLFSASLEVFLTIAIGFFPSPNPRQKLKLGRKTQAFSGFFPGSKASDVVLDLVFGAVASQGFPTEIPHVVTDIWAFARWWLASTSAWFGRVEEERFFDGFYGLIGSFKGEIRGIQKLIWITDK